MNYVQYIKGLQNVLARIAGEQSGNIRRAGTIMAAALQHGGVIHTFGTGHSHIIAEEVFFRAGGIAAVNPILDERFIFLQGALESTASATLPRVSRENPVRPRVPTTTSSAGRSRAALTIAMAAGPSTTRRSPSA